MSTDRLDTATLGGAQHRDHAAAQAANAPVDGERRVSRPADGGARGGRGLVTTVEPVESRRVAGRILAGVIGAGVLLRAGAALYLGDRVTAVSGAADQVTYDALAIRILEGHGYSFATGWYPFTPPDHPTAHWSYAYPLYLAAVYAVAGHHPLVARLVQVLASASGLWLTARIARRLFGEPVGIVAAALAAVYAYFVFFNAALMTQTFYIVALLAALDRVLVLARDPDRGGWAMLGLVLGVATLLRQTMLLFVPILLGWLLWQGRGRVGWRGPLVVLAVIAALVLPWTVRNRLVFGDFLLLNSNAGFWFYSSNHPGQGTHFDPNYVAPIPDDLHALGEPALDRALLRAGLGFIVDEPGRFARLTLSRAANYFWILPSGESSTIANAARLCSFALYAPFMLGGLWLSRTRWRACMPLYLYVAFDTVLHLTSWAAPRYRLPSDALLMVFAALCVARLGERLRSGRTA